MAEPPPTPPEAPGERKGLKRKFLAVAVEPPPTPPEAPGERKGLKRKFLAVILLGQTASRRNARELHHIWPRELLRRHGVSPKRFNTICNICFLAAQDNRSFGARHPLSYLEDFWSRKHFAQVMKSHLIPYQNQSPLWDTNVPRGFKAFAEERRRLIETAFNTAAGVRLFEK